MDGLSVYTLPPSPANFDRIGTFYVAFAATWSALLFAGMAFLWMHRHNPIIKIRGLPLSFAAIGMLHAYWILAQVVYPVGQTMNLVLAYDIQYFFMGIWLPLGIALFQASNSRFLHIAELQRQYTPSYIRRTVSSKRTNASWLSRVRNLEYSKRILVYIGIGMVGQVLLTIGMWLACRKYHPTFGIAGTELRGSTILEQLIDLGRGWEWWPTLFWQVIWTWMVAPYLIWHSWGIRDTLGWRTQTIGCCISGLHATPMFLIASYVPAFAPVNAYFAPSEWIHLSSMMFEVFTVFIPCWLVIRHRSMRMKAVESNAKWDTFSQMSVLKESPSKDWMSASAAEKGSGATEPSSEDNDDRILTMTALNQVLEENPTPLLEFSALRDFSGENIAFLTRVSTWKSSFPENPTEEQTREAFTNALAIYTDFVSPRDAEFPVNLSWQDLAHLEGVFERAARVICGAGRVNPAAPFLARRSHLQAHDSSVELRGPSEESGSRIELGQIASRIQYAGHISDDFGPTVFDTAHKHVRYLVLTNTWPKYVAEMRQQRRRSGESERSNSTNTSSTSLASRVSKFIQSMT